MTEAMSRTLGDRVDKMWYIEGLYTHPDHQGRGYGGTLLDTVTAVVRNLIDQNPGCVDINARRRPTQWRRPRIYNRQILKIPGFIIFMGSLRSRRWSLVTKIQSGVVCLSWLALCVIEIRGYVPLLR